MAIKRGEFLGYHDGRVVWENVSMPVMRIASVPLGERVRPDDPRWPEVREALARTDPWVVKSLP